MNSVFGKTESQLPALQPKKKIAPLYLDDYTPVRTIEVSNFAEDVSTEFLRGFFECAAGPVSDVHFVTKYESHVEGSKRVAVVTFVVPEDAARLIGDADRPFKFRFTIKQAERQPNIDPNAMKLEEIIDDCMLVIASNLNLVDVINLGKSSIRFQSFVQQIYCKQTHFSSIAGDSSINKSNVEMILEEIGVYVESIEWNDLQANELDFLSKNCPNVTALKLWNASHKLTSQIVRKNKRFFAKLEKLHISGGSLFDTSLQMMASSPALQSLFINCCHNVHGRFLPRLKTSQLKALKMENLFVVDHSRIVNFVRARKLVTFRCDNLSFQQLFELPAETVSTFETISLKYSPASDAKLDLVHFNDLKQLTTLDLYILEGIAFPNYNTILAGASRIPKLQSLTVEGLTINAETLTSLGLYKNLQRIRFVQFKNTIGKPFYSSLHTHLPNITELIIVQYNSDEKFELKWICELITSLKELKSFYLSSMTWPLMNMILQERMRLKLPAIEIRVWKSLGEDAEKIKFDAANKGAIKVSPYNKFVPDFS